MKPPVIVCLFEPAGISFSDDRPPSDPTPRIRIGTSSHDRRLRQSDFLGENMAFITPHRDSIDRDVPSKGKAVDTCDHVRRSLEAALPASDGHDLDAMIEEAFRKSVEAMDEAWGRGELAPEKIESAIQTHRKNHPYRHV